MSERKTKPHRALKIAARCFAALIVLAIIIGLLLWNRWMNKNSLLAGYDAPSGQEVYILGTLHKYHFEKAVNYSMEDILSAVESLQPDAVFIEAREETFEEYGLIDGPVDMCVVYSCCKDKGIPVELVDFWQIDNDFQEDTTDDERDDNIFANIESKLSESSENARVLVVCGSGHFYEQQKRFKAAGFEKKKLTNVSDFFAATDESFAYPLSAAEIWEGRARFYAYVNPEIVRADPTLSQEIKDGFWSWDHDAYYNEQTEYCDLFRNNELYR